MTLKDKTVLVIGRPSGIARSIADAAHAHGAGVIVAGRRPRELAEAYGPGTRAETVDLTDDESIAALAERVGRVDHIVSTASARARGTIADLDRDAVRRSLDTKVIGPLMLARAFQHQINEGGSMLLFSGVAAFKIESGTVAVAITNGAADTLTRSLAVALAPTASTRSRQEWSTRAPGTRSAKRARLSCSPRRARATRPGASAAPTTSPPRRSSP